MIHAVTIQPAPQPTAAGVPRAGAAVAGQAPRRGVRTAVIASETKRDDGRARAPRSARRSPLSAAPSAAELRHAEALARQVQAHFPPRSAVVLQVGLGESGAKGGSGIVLQLIDRMTHQVYFRIPPDQASPVVARLVVNGMGSGLFVDSKI